MTLVLSFIYFLQGQTTTTPSDLSSLQLKLNPSVKSVIHQAQLFYVQSRVLYLMAIVCYHFEKLEDLSFALVSFGVKILVQIQGQLTHSPLPLHDYRIYSLHFLKLDGIV